MRSMPLNCICRVQDQERKRVQICKAAWTRRARAHIRGQHVLVISIVHVVSSAERDNLQNNTPFAGSDRTDTSLMCDCILRTCATNMHACLQFEAK